MHSSLYMGIRQGMGRRSIEEEQRGREGEEGGQDRRQGLRGGISVVSNGIGRVHGIVLLVHAV